MSIHKRFTNKAKTNYSWGFCVNIPSSEYDKHGNLKRKQCTKSGFETKKEALKAERKFLETLEKGKLELNKNATFNDIISFFLEYAECEGKYAKGTIANYKTLNSKYFSIFKCVKIDKITPNLIRTWKRNLAQDNISDYRINDCTKLIKASFNYAIREKQITTNPFKDLKKTAIRPILRKRFSTNELTKIFNECELKIPNFYCIFTLACLTGMRVGEYSALTINDINFATKEIYVNKQYTRGELKYRNKTNESTRIVHPSQKVLSILKWHIEKYQIKEGFLFKDSNNNPVSSKWVSRSFKTLLRACGYDEDYCRVHDLRGQYVDIMHSCGIPTEYISREVGHSNTSTTSNIYTQILKEVPEFANQRMDEKIFA